MRGTKALLTNNEYEKRLLESLEMIKTKSRSLMEEALKSHIYESHICMHTPLKYGNSIKLISLPKILKRHKNFLGTSRL